MIFILYPTALQILSLSRINYILLVFNIISILDVIQFLLISSLYNKIHHYVPENIFKVSIHLCPLTNVLILDASIINTCAEIIDSF